MFTMTNLRSYLGDVKARLQVLDKDILDLKDKRTKLVSAPLPLDDFVNWACEQVDVAGTEWPVRIASVFAHTHFSNYMTTRGEGYDNTSVFEDMYSTADGIRVPLFNLNHQPGVIGLDAFCWMFSNEIKQGLRSAMTAALQDKWPTNVGSPREKRLADLKKIDAEIEKLTSERDRIRSDLADIGTAAS